MLPIHDKKRMMSFLGERRLGKGDTEVASEVLAPESEIDPALREAATDILSAIQNKSVIDLANAIKAAFEVCSSYDDMEYSEEMDMGE